ncbi:AMP-binding enzyme family protein [Mycolicibacterium canariasense]|uniref:AMP-binding enzyme family protein n=1 Tax=Mycolicibacterium canariasense TaxID=228230 RepID=A0A100WHN6_MYCCR|nr:AMP-binding protein [Mycolicibacterium canariasense]MCV7211739.1 AMP-binding protein [Mycolicibacterium canariasense]ORV08185.1 AMP-binding protein [Mycolicibacterium canariasense]GAS98266.1 AMP-binding enzyme family protein [Mycolicibacterium canariasense]
MVSERTFRTTTPNDNSAGTVPVLQSIHNFEASPRTFGQLLVDRAAHEPDTVAFASWLDGVARPTTWGEYLTEVQQIAVGLYELGVRAGDRVAVISATRREWVIAALAIHSLDAVLVGVYPTSSVPELARVLQISEATAIFAETESDLRKVAAAARDSPHLRIAIGIESTPAGLPATVQATDWHALQRVGWARSAAEPGLFGVLVAGGDIDHPAVLFWTSGSTGDPKAVIHTHRSLQYSVLAFAMAYPDIGRVQHDAVAFLGLSHVAPALVNVFVPIMTRLVVTYCTMDERLAVLSAVRPTAIVWPPRMYEKLAGELLEQLRRSGPLFRARYAAAMTVARVVCARRWENRALSRPLEMLYRSCIRTVFTPLRATYGMDRIAVSWTSSGAMTPELAALWQMWGVDLREMYGTTETCGPVLVQWERSFYPPGTVGKSLPDPRWSVRVSDDGELQVNGPCLFTGYWRDPMAAEPPPADVWYGTGDLVEIRPDGEVAIIGRIKDVLKTSGGKSVSPQPIEVRLKASPLIDEAIVVGEGRKYLTVLLSISDDARSLPAPEQRAALNAWVQEVNAELARPLQLKDFRVLPRALSAELGELTLKSTIRRGVVLASFADLVDEMYTAREQDQISSQARLSGRSNG